MGDLFGNVQPNRGNAGPLSGYRLSAAPMPSTDVFVVTMLKTIRDRDGHDAATTAD